VTDQELLDWGIALLSCNRLKRGLLWEDKAAGWVREARKRGEFHRMLDAEIEKATQEIRKDVADHARAFFGGDPELVGLTWLAEEGPQLASDYIPPISKFYQ
jgi:hypothetical protein